MNPTQAKVLKDAIRAALLNVNTCLPGVVTSVDVAAGKCDAKPVLRRKFASGEIVDLPVITNVPIAQLRAGKAFVSVPVKVGDYVLLVFSQRSIDLWLTSGGSVDPKDPRSHALSDAIAYPGVYPFSDPPAGALADALVIKNDQSTIIVKPNGEIKVEAPAKLEVVAGEVDVQCDNATVVASGNVDATAAAMNLTSTGPIQANTPLLNVSGLIGCAGLAVGGTPVAGEANISGNVNVTGNVDATGDVEDANGTMDEMRTIYNGHDHSDPQGGTVGPPNQPMT